VSRILAALAPAAAAAAVAFGGCGGAAHGGDGPSVTVPGQQTPLQAANGPIAAAPGERPLTLRPAAADEQLHVRFPHPPGSGLVFDLDTGAVLWQRLPTRVLPIASLTKIMTALLVDDAGAQPAKARITRAAVDTGGSKVGVLPRGKDVPVQTLLAGLLLPSGNDAAVALAQHVSGSVPRFVQAMNARAGAMGLTCTRFASPSGLVDRGNHSCAADLAQLARAILDRPRLARIVRRRQAVLPLPVKGGHVWLYNNNPLLRLGYAGTIGIKTGYTDAAGHCLVAAVRRGGRRLGIVLLHSPDTGAQARRLLDRAFAHSTAPT
jgi:serine-type D-Ala-D-Ala carboxypeptidase (penicillin-binding protein 5/6)